MPLAAGARLGPYEIVSPLGAGGMGEVYRAKDTRLGRDVAVKILPPHLSENEEVRERFEREARAISSLNHPHICTLFDVGRDGAAEYFVMELLEGESVAARLERGPMKLDETLRIAAQIADALAAAHKQGIVHRDLKPGNVVITKSGAKVLDFGVAKLRDESVVDNRTRTTPLTSMGTMLGTVQYMSPEQLEGLTVDHRADLFAFGALLYEMLTGQRAFPGTSQASVIAAILDKDPRPISEILPASPPALDRMVKLCLAKDPDERWQSAGDLARELRWIAGGTGTGPVAAPAAPAVRRRATTSLTPWIIAALASIAAVIAVGMLVRRPPPVSAQAPLRRFSIGAPPDASLPQDGVNFRLSPDGHTLAFLASLHGVSSLWIRPLGSLAARRIPGTEDGNIPFWSPDGRYLGYFGSGKLKKVLISGASPEAICNAGDGRGATWSRDGVIVFAPESAGPLYQVRESGGEPEPVTVLDAGRKETAHRWPFFLPDGKHFLYVTLPARKGAYDVFAGSIASKDRTLLFSAGSAPIYAEPGYLIYPKESTLFAQPFDAAHVKTKGDPVSLGDAPAPSDWSGSYVVSASSDGVLARWGMALPDTGFQFFDRAGRVTGELAVPPGRYERGGFSPDGKRIAVLRRSSVVARDLWLLDVDHATPTRFTFDAANLDVFAWSRDGRSIAYESDRDGGMQIFVKPTDGAAEAKLLPVGAASFNAPTTWSADGKLIVFEQPDPKSGWDLLTVPADGTAPPTPLIHTASSERFGEVSPDGHWIAYMSDETGRLELFVQSFPVPGAKYQVTTGGATNNLLRWTKGGREIIFASGDALTIMAVEVSAGASFRSGAPRELFKVRADYVGIDVTPDGERFMVVAATGPPILPSITIDVNWTAQLAK